MFTNGGQRKHVISRNIRSVLQDRRNIRIIWTKCTPGMKCTQMELDPDNVISGLVKTTIVTASQVGDRLVCMDNCYFHQTATLNLCVFLFLLLFSQKTNVIIVFSVKFSFKIIFYLQFWKNGLLLFSQRTLQSNI